uniref:VWFA domain-containing protein n=1 Tax=Anguilla anguilla TaxID=7936 RepID=A0A0E9UWR1_ANGAN
MKTFVIKLIESLLGRNSKFAVMQYSAQFQTVFDFKTFKKNSDWRGQINDIIQLSQTTHTPTAISKVV